MLLNQLKQIRSELQNSADAYDNAFKNVSLIAAEELVQSEQQLRQQLNNQQPKSVLNIVLDKQFFINKYGNLKNAKTAYTEINGEQKYGRSWSDFIAVAKELNIPEPKALTLEARITKIEDFLVTLGYKK